MRRGSFAKRPTDTWDHKSLSQLQKQMTPLHPRATADKSIICEQDTVVWCQGGQLSRLNCADLQQTCGWIDDSSGNYCVDDPTRAPSPESETPEAPDDGCGDIDHNGVCEGEGDVAVWCSGGSLRRFDCRTERQQTCA